VPGGKPHTLPGPALTAAALGPGDHRPGARLREKSG